MAKRILLVRHGQTEWSLNGRHTSTTDLELTESGAAAADALKPRLDAENIDVVLSSPRIRALDTARRATGRDDIEITEDLVEWFYGDYEGLTTAEVRTKLAPGWNLWTDGAPGGESPQDVTERVHRLFDRINSLEGVVACFAHGHILRAIAALWTGEPISLGQHLKLETSSISKLSTGRDGNVIDSWNDLTA